MAGVHAEPQRLSRRLGGGWPSRARARPSETRRRRLRCRVRCDGDSVDQELWPGRPATWRDPRTEWQIEALLKPIRDTVGPLRYAIERLIGYKAARKARRFQA